MAKDLQFTFRRPCLELSGEIGSLSELIGYMQEESASLTLMFGDDMEMTVQRIGGASTAPTAAEGSGTEPARRTRGPNKAKPPVEAVAPEPLPVPAAAPPIPAAPPPVLPSPPTAPVAPVAPPPGFEIPADGGLPPALVRAPPPVGVLGPKVVAALNVLREGKPDGGQALADWLAAAGLTIKGKTYDEASRAVLMISDEKITAAGVLEPLGIS